jgi:putative transcriptional regulator
MSTSMKIEWNLDVIMKQKKLKLEEVSRLTSIHRNVLSRIKNNQQERVDLHTIERLLLGLNVTPNDLFRFVYIKKEKTSQ